MGISGGCRGALGESCEALWEASWELPGRKHIKGASKQQLHGVRAKAPFSRFRGARHEQKSSPKDKNEEDN